MTSDEKKAAVKTGRIIRASRKSKGWTQIETAQKMGISQSALSKLEAGLLIPSVHQWFEFCNYAGIPTDSHLLGHLDGFQALVLKAQIDKGDFKVKAQYADQAGSSARSLFPVLKWIETKLGAEKSNLILKEMGVDPDYFVDFNHSINFRFYADLFPVMKSNGIFRKSDLSKMTQPVSELRNHGRLSTSYLPVQDLSSLFSAAFSRSNFYDVNFEYKVEESGPKKTIFSAKPKEHLKDYLALPLQECRDFLCEYRGHYFQNLAASVPTQSPLQSKELSCFFDGADRCVHEIS